jgi:hypothetical protein
MDCANNKRLADKAGGDLDDERLKPNSNQSRNDCPYCHQPSWTGCRQGNAGGCLLHRAGKEEL